MFEFVVTGLNVIFSPITIFPSHVAILIFSVILTLIIFGLNRLVINRKLVKELKEKMDKIRADLSQAQKDGDKERTNSLFTEMMGLNNSYMKQTFKSLIVSIVIIAIFLPWARYKYENVTIAMPFSLPFIGSSLSWLLWYILVSFTVGWFFQKLQGGYY